MRLIAEALERSGVAAVVVDSMRGMLQGLPRVLVTRHPRGANFGPAGAEEVHRAIAREALQLFETREPVFRNHQDDAPS